MPYDPSTSNGQVRLLINDTSPDPVFDDSDIDAFLALEGGLVKLAAAQALETIADDEALTSKVVSTASGNSTNGAAVAASLRERAKNLREQVLKDGDEAGYFEIIQPEIDCWYGWPV